MTRAARNAHLMDAMRYLGYVQMAREGTRRIRDSMKEYGLPDPKFKQEVLHGVVVRVSLMNDSETRKRATDKDVALHFGVELWRTLQEHEVKLAAYTFRNGAMQVSEAARITGRTWQTSKKDLDRLCRKGVLMFVPGQYQRDPKAHYVLYKRRRMNQKNQVERFREAARDLECDDDPERFAERVGKIAKAPPAPKGKAVKPASKEGDDE